MGYPSAVKKLFGAGVAVPLGARRIFQGLAYHSTDDLAILTRWLEIETLMKNQNGIDGAQEGIKRARKASVKAETEEFSDSEHSTDVPETMSGEYEEDDQQQQEPTADGCEVFNAKGEIIGVGFRGRVWGKCPASGCACFEPLHNSSRLCATCSRPSFDHDDHGPLHAISHGPLVRISCLKAPQDSLDVLHVELPSGSSVRQLRFALRELIPPNADFFVKQTGQLLKNESVAPTEVSVSEITKAVSGDAALVKSQAREAQEMLITKFREQETQQVLDFMERQTAGKATRFRKELQSYLASSVYPDIAVRFGMLPSDGARHLGRGIAHHSTGDICMLENWVMVELLMRNEGNVRMAEIAVGNLLNSGGTAW